MAKSKKKAGEINSSSMADIAFLLLIFFLVTTTMDVDMGMRRTLPPIAGAEQDDNVELHQRNILLVNVARNGSIMVGNQIYKRADLNRNGDHSRLSKETYDFLVDVNRSEKEPMEFDGGKTFGISKGIVSLKADKETTYDVYLQVQDELTHAFNVYRDYVSGELYGKSFDELDEEQQENLRKKTPPRISEAEPNDQTTK